MNENIDDFEGGLIEVIGDRNRKIIIAKEIGVGDICPVTTSDQWMRFRCQVKILNNKIRQIHIGINGLPGWFC